MPVEPVAQTASVSNASTADQAPKPVTPDDDPGPPPACLVRPLRPEDQALPLWQEAARVEG